MPGRNDIMPFGSSKTGLAGSQGPSVSKPTFFRLALRGPHRQSCTGTWGPQLILQIRLSGELLTE